MEDKGLRRAIKIVALLATVVVLALGVRSIAETREERRDANIEACQAAWEMGAPLTDECSTILGRD